MIIRHHLLVHGLQGREEVHEGREEGPDEEVDEAAQGPTDKNM